MSKRYFEMLYSINLPMYYFAKTTISRLESVYKVKEGQTRAQEMKKLNQIILQLVLDLEDFDTRHELKPASVLGLLTAECKSHEIQYRDDYKKKNQELVSGISEILENEQTQASNSSKDLWNKYCLMFKIREAQLQVLLILEYLFLDMVDIENSNMLVEENEKILSSGNGPQVGANLFNGYTPRLVRSRKRKPKSIAKTNVYYRNLLNTYLDRLSIWDIILQSLGSSDSIEGLDNELVMSSNFVNKAVVPYFFSKSPHIIKFIRKKMLGELPSKGVIKRAKTVTLQVSSLRSKDIAQKFTLEARSKTLKKSQSSNAALTDMLSKREVDFTIVKPKLKRATKSKSLIGDNVFKKSKTVVQASKSFSQIEATPMKDSSLKHTILEGIPKKNLSLQLFLVNETLEIPSLPDFEFQDSFMESLPTKIFDKEYMIESDSE